MGGLRGWACAAGVGGSPSPGQAWHRTWGRGLRVPGQAVPSRGLRGRQVGGGQAEGLEGSTPSTQGPSCSPLPKVGGFGEAQTLHGPCASLVTQPGGARIQVRTFQARSASRSHPPLRGNVWKC